MKPTTMKRRGWRVALTVATLGLALVAGLVAFNWPTVRDHAEAWWFQMKEETVVIRPSPAFLEHCKAKKGLYFDGSKHLLLLLASTTGIPVIAHRDAVNLKYSFGTSRGPSAEFALRYFSSEKWRVVEQRLPRRAYVVVGYPQATLTPMPLSEPISVR